ncbi:hypothetical protein FRB98_004741 [Tulasnella sp. 332]|nr:hypothetical protein FRB98_004741 [Tulasnella sp. 332]
MGRKPRVTIKDLEQELHRLEHKYSACLKAAEIETKNGTTESAETARDRGRVREESAHSNPSEVITSPHGRRHSDRSSPTLSDHPFEGYHFDESFLAIPSYSMSASPILPETPSQSNHLETTTYDVPPPDLHIDPHPIRVFSPASPQTSNSPDGSFPKAGSPDPEEERTAAKRRRMKSPINVNALSATTQNEAVDSPHLPRQRSSTPEGADIAHPPTLHFSRATWWDCLLCTYSIWPDAPHPIVPRPEVTAEISRDVYIFFQAAPRWLSFLHVPLFFENFYHPERRAKIQPALVLSILAYAKLLRSNQDPGCEQSLEERERAWRQSAVLRDLAQASFEASYNAGCLDLPLAQAAWSSVALLDNVVHAMGLTFIDSMDPRASTFAADAAPTLGRTRPNVTTESNLQLSYSSTATKVTSPPSIFLEPRSLSGPIKRRASITDSTLSGIHQYPPAKPAVSLDDGDGAEVPANCPCEALSLLTTPELLRSTPAWKLTPRWTLNASLGEIQKEEARRLVWSTVLMLGCNANARLTVGLPQQDLYISRPENVSFLGCIFSRQQD